MSSPQGQPRGRKLFDNRNKNETGMLAQMSRKSPLGIVRSQGGSESKDLLRLLCVSCRGLRESAQNLVQVGTNQPQVGTNDRQVVTNPPIARITPLLSMRVSVCRLEGGILMTAGLTRRNNG